VLGKTNVSQALLYVESDNPLYGRTNNPWNLERSAGGSSGGEAAIVAAGGAALGLGTDIGGSVRVPAHFCGLCSFKPTPGRLTVAGTADELLFAGNEAIPDTAGPLARSVADLTLALRVLSEPVLPLPDPGRVDLRQLRVGVYEDDGFYPASAAVRRAVRHAADALRDAGATVEEFQPPDVPSAISLGWGLLAPDSFDRIRRLLGADPRDARLADILLLTGMPNPLRPIMAALLRAKGQRGLAALLPTAGRRSSAQFLVLSHERQRYAARFTAVLDERGIDVLLCPPCSVPAVTHGATRELAVASVNYTFLFNLLRYPAGVVSVTRVRPDEETGRPASKDPMEETARLVDLGSAGLPIGVQVAARPWRDDVVLATMAALEAHFRTQPDYPVTPVLLPSG
jgi:fatty acid amide hydrolase